MSEAAVLEERPAQPQPTSKYFRQPFNSETGRAMGIKGSAIRWKGHVKNDGQVSVTTLTRDLNQSSQHRDAAFLGKIALLRRVHTRCLRTIEAHCSLEKVSELTALMDIAREAFSQEMRLLGQDGTSKPRKSGKAAQRKAVSQVAPLDISGSGASGNECNPSGEAKPATETDTDTPF